VVQSTDTGRIRPQHRTSKKSIRFLMQPWLQRGEEEEGERRGVRGERRGVRGGGRGERRERKG